MPDRALAHVQGYWPRLGALSLAMLLSSLGTSIANVALPTLARSFDAAMAEVQWVVIAYLLAVTSLIVGAGRLGDLIGRRRLFLAGMTVFCAASALCALSPNLPVLIAARAVQGLGGAVMMTLAVAMVGDLVPTERTGSAIGMLGTISAVGTALGPSLGGALISLWGWPSVFAVLAALGAAAVLAGSALLPADSPSARRPAGFDLRGLILLAFSLAAFSAVFTLGERLQTPALIGIAIASATGFAAFIRTERRASAPLVRLDLLGNRALGTALASLMMVSAIVMATLVVGPFYLSGVLGLDPVRTGIVMSVGPVVAALTGIPAGRLVDRLAAYPVIVSGLVAVVVGALSLAVLPGLLGAAGYAASLAVLTFGYAMFQTANMTAIMQRTVSADRGLTSALLGLSRNMGLIWGASAMAALYAVGPRLAAAAGLGHTGGAGLALVFAVSACLGAAALCATIWGRPTQ
ncbi:MAG: MFS transporter [Roseivivax sp.]|nr:MFS transporter [Roseivivax sp.]